MDVYRNALQDVLHESGFKDFTVTIENNPDKDYELISTIGMTGELSGYVILRSDLESARSFAVHLASGMGMLSKDSETLQFGQFHKDAITEITNQIAGRAIMLLSQTGYDCNITPPTLIIGNRIFTDMVSFNTFSSWKVTGSFGEIALFVCLKTLKM